jgi:hypothetical protein
MATRFVSSFAPTSTIWALPAPSKCVKSFKIWLSF